MAVCGCLVKGWASICVAPRACNTEAVINPMEVGPMSEDYPRPLLERVSCAIDRSICPDQWLHQDAARAAIREVAAWIRERAGYPHSWIAQTLEQEAAQPTSQED
jgi:hypothetical protein